MTDKQHSRPARYIDDQLKLDQFLASRGFAELWAFILRLNAAVSDKKVSSVARSSLQPGVAELVRLLETLRRWVDEIEPVQQAARYGNKAFRTWCARLEADSRDLMSGVLVAGGVADEEGWIASELGAYLETSFGNSTRIDYGTGHEAHFCLLLHLLEQLGVFTETDHAAVVLVVFADYLKTTRAVQERYKLEPAGSHGVWGLDDYSFLPFLWGSSQLLSAAPRIKPTVIDDELDEALRSEYLYLDAIAFIKQVKSGPFFEHSPTLYDISRLRAGWPKINQGLLKMYKGEVWHKLPVIQMFLFGRLFPVQQHGDGRDENVTPRPPQPQSYRPGGASGNGNGNRADNESGDGNGDGNRDGNGT